MRNFGLFLLAAALLTPVLVQAKNCSDEVKERAEEFAIKKLLMKPAKDKTTIEVNRSGKAARVTITSAVDETVRDVIVKMSPLTCKISVVEELK